MTQHDIPTPSEVARPEELIPALPTEAEAVAKAQRISRTYRRDASSLI